jgi:hypothetical protein
MNRFTLQQQLPASYADFTKIPIGRAVLDAVTNFDTDRELSLGIISHVVSTGMSPEDPEIIGELMSQEDGQLNRLTSQLSFREFFIVHLDWYEEMMYWLDSDVVPVFPFETAPAMAFVATTSIVFTVITLWKLFRSTRVGLCLLPQSIA